VHGEGIVSMIGAPLFRDERLIGVLYVGDRSHRTFDHDEPTLVSALAGQAAIAIENSRLLQQLDTKNRMLEHTASIHARLTSVSLSDVGVDGIARELADLVGRPIWLFQDLIAPPAQRFGSDAADGVVPDLVHSVPVLAGETELGTLAVEGAEPLTELDRRALEQGAVVIAVELLRHRARQEVEWRLGGELLGAVLATSGPVDGRLAARAQRFGLDLRQPHMVIVLESTADEPLDLAVVQSAVRRASNVNAGQRGAVLVAATGVDNIAVTVPSQRSGMTETLLAHLRDGNDAASARFIAGISRSSHDLSAAHREAMACVRLARISGIPGKVISAGDLGAMRFLFSLEDPAPVREYVAEQLGALLDHEAGKESPLFVTLRAYLNASGHHPTIAARCHIHPSTVKYRISRLEAVLDRRLSDPQVRFELQLAVALLDFLWAVGIES
jgi:sugar diacid utilization regulator